MYFGAHSKNPSWGVERATAGGLFSGLEPAKLPTKQNSISTISMLLDHIGESTVYLDNLLIDGIEALEQLKIVSAS